MSMEGKISGAGRAAMHCAQLVTPAPVADDGLGQFARLGAALAPLLAARLEPLFMAGAWETRVTACELALSDTLDTRIGPVAGNFLLPVGDAGGRLFASFALAPLGARLSRMFGGDAAGETKSFGPRLPSSVVMLLRRLERALTEALGECLDEAVMRPDDGARFEPDFAKLGCFPATTQAALLGFSFHSQEGAPLELLLACRKTMLARLMGHFHATGAAAARVQPDLLDPAIGAIPLPLRVQLAEMKLSARRLLGLRPGQVLPISVARSVPLMVQGMRLATGSIGEQDDRIAIQIEHILMNGDAA